MKYLNHRDNVTWLLWIAVIGVSSWMGGCASAPEEKGWIVVGRTTQNEVVNRYGQPDIIQMTGDGSIVTYQPASVQQPIQPRLEIPTVQAGPFGTNTTQMKPVEPGLGRTDTNMHPQHEIKIRYDRQGVVQEVMP